MKMRASGYYWKLIVLSLLIGTFPVLTLGYYSYYYSTDTVRKKVNEGNKHILLQTQMRIEQLMKTIDQSATQFSTSNLAEKVYDISLSNDYFDTFIELGEALIRLQSYELPIEDIHFINLKHRWVRNNSGLQPLEKVFGRQQVEELKQLKEASFWVRADKIFPGERAQNGDSGMILVKKLPFYYPEPVGIMIVRISSASISKLMTTSENFGRFFILDDEFGVVSGGNDALESLPAPANVSLEKAFSPGPAVEGTLKTEQAILTFRKSAYNDWIYASSVSMDAVMQDSRNIGWITLLLCTLILLITLFIAFLGSKKMYIPISRLHQSLLRHIGSARTGSLGENAPAEKTTQDELQMINAGVQQLMSSHLELSDRLQGQTRQLKEFFLLKLYQGEVQPAAVPEKTRFYEFPESFSWLCVVTIQIDTLENTHYQEKDKELLLFALNNIVGETIPAERGAISVLLHKSQVTLLPGPQENRSEFVGDVFGICEQIQSRAEFYLKLKISFGISRPFRDYADMPSAYQEGLEALRYRIRLGQEAILFIEEVQPAQPVHSAFPEELERKLLDSVKFGDKEEARRQLSEFISRLSQESASYQEYQLFLVRLLSDILRIFQQSGATVQAWFEQEPLLDKMLSIRTPQEMENWFRQALIEPGIRLMEDSTDLQYKRIAEEIVRMIQEEYDTDLTLEMCAERMNYHYGLIRRVLRKELDVNFSDYLAQYRMSVAKQLLAETEMKIADIAEKIRYNNPQNFIRSFRRVEGVTPGQYRTVHGRKAKPAWTAEQKEIRL